MKTSQLNLAVAFFHLLAFVAACGAPGANRGQSPGARGPAPRIIQPGAPGESSRTLGPSETAAARPPEHVEADVRFMQGMIHHHAQALAMTGLLAERTGSEEMRTLAGRINISQTDEIRMMRRWLGVRGEDAPAYDDGHMMALGDDDLMPGMLTGAEMTQLAAANGDEFDRMFLEGMIYHHQGALIMVQELFSSPGAGEEPDIFQFAFHVDADQYIEIERMGQMLQARR